jgi:hypothetical protein
MHFIPCSLLGTRVHSSIFSAFLPHLPTTHPQTHCPTRYAPPNNTLHALHPTLLPLPAKDLWKRTCAYSLPSRLPADHPKRATRIQQNSQRVSRSHPRDIRGSSPLGSGRGSCVCLGTEGVGEVFVEDLVGCKSHGELGRRADDSVRLSAGLMREYSRPTCLARPPLYRATPHISMQSLLR